MLDNAIKFKKADDEYDEGVAAKNAFENFTFVVKKFMEDDVHMNKLNQGDKDSISLIKQEGDKFLENNPSASSKEYEKKQDALMVPFKAIRAKVMDFTPMEVVDDDDANLPVEVD